MKLSREEQVRELLIRLEFELTITTDAALRRLLEDLYNFMWAEECNK